MMNFGSVCYFPALCMKCRRLVQVNLLSKTVRCPRCRSRRVKAYDSNDLVGEVGRNEVTSWHVEDKLGRDLLLTDGRYLCPSCGEYKLRFEEGGLLWD